MNKMEIAIRELNENQRETIEKLQADNEMLLAALEKMWVWQATAVQEFVPDDVAALVQAAIAKAKE